MKRTGFVSRKTGWMMAIGFVVTATIGAASPACAQESAAADQGSWRVIPLPHVDLWNHGLAVVGFEGSGPDPLYDPSYRARIREVKEGLGVYPSTLDRRSPSLAAAFQADSAFELLHFVPLYFASAGPDRMLDALTQVAETGTATVELAAMGIPQVACYRVHPLTWAAGRMLVRGIRHLALPNIDNAVARQPGSRIYAQNAVGLRCQRRSPGIHRCCKPLERRQALPKHQ